LMVIHLKFSQQVDFCISSFTNSQFQSILETFVSS
jgi:hypothetical protein